MLVEAAKLESEKVQLQSKGFELELNLKRMIEEMTRIKEQSVKSFSDEKKMKQEE